ncbi:napL protein [Campylobacter sp. MIT 99-7217]|uniref:WD40 repeat domain-containing protein n=1 Tax=Campylobacter sp. MIT 99-7217 TaxID=535091 RepID=UPI001159116A|nr:WD40 repeat domain-containing protein [Campylobacter sp. MIT 99-7217]TQR33007.1 napL protein [Campylobacter sp. MIT 99-7217]
MLRKCLTFLCFSLFLFAYELKLPSNLTALNSEGKFLFIGTIKGEILSFDTEKKELKEIFALQNIKNYYDDKADSQIYSLDIFNNQLLIVSSGDFGGLNLGVLNLKTKEFTSKKLDFDSVKKAFFIDENTILLALLSSDIKLLNLKDLKEIKSFKFSHSSLNDAALSKDRTKLVTGFESGEVKLFDIPKWQLEFNYDKNHKDGIYQVDIKNNTLISCSTDRKIGLIKNGKESFLQKNFLIYACALNENAKVLAYADNEAGVVELLDTKDFKPLFKAENVNFMVEFVLFMGENTFLIAGFHDKILIFDR